MSSNDETMDVDPPARLSVVSNPARFKNLIQFGQGLQAMLQEMDSLTGLRSEANQRMLQVGDQSIGYLYNC